MTTGVALATGDELRARLVFTAGRREWVADVPLRSRTANGAMTALAAAIKLLVRKVRVDWEDEERRVLIAARPARRRIGI